MEQYFDISHQLAEHNPVNEAQIKEAEKEFNLQSFEQIVASSIVGFEADKKSFLFERLSGETNLFFGKQRQYQALLNELKSRQYSSDDEMAKVVGKKMHDFAIQNFSYEQLGQNLYRDQGFEELNDVLSYGGSLRIIHIHMEPKANVLVGKKPREKVNYLMEQLNDGLHKLAVLLQTDPRWKNVEIITAASWLVAKHPKLLESLKFKVESNLKGGPRTIRGAFIYRRDFLREYGSNK